MTQKPTDIRTITSAPRQDETDAASRSLADALGVSFGILKLLMVVLVIAYALSGIFNVQENRVGVRLRFGKLLTQADGSPLVLTPGGPYFSWPFPINDKIIIDTTNRSVKIDRAFWFEIDQALAGQTSDEMAGASTGPLNPEKDGSLLTGDANVAHARWTVYYEVDPRRVDDFLRTVQTPERADQLVQFVGEQAAVATLAQMTAEAFNRGLTPADYALAMQVAQRSLDKVSSGLRITDIVATQAVFPVSVRDAFQAVTSAESEKAQAVEKARSERTRILGRAAGEAADVLAGLIADYERAYDLQDTAELQRIDATLDTIFTTLNTGPAYGNIAVGGQVASTINEASAYRTRLTERVRSDSEYFLGLLPQYQQNPRIVLARLWQTTRQEILESPQVESFYTPDGRLYLELNRDPAVSKRRVETQLKADQERRQRENANP